MILKEAYRYQNFLDRLLSEVQTFLMSETFITNVKQTHHRKKANPDAQDEVIEVKKRIVSGVLQLVSAPAFTPMQAVDFTVRALEEKEKLSLAILEAKKTTKIDMDHTVAMNKKRQEFIATLKFMDGVKDKEEKSGGTDYKFNQEGNQVSYCYDIDEVVTIDFDRKDVKGLIKKLTKQCDELSIILDGLLVTTKVDYTPIWDINDSLEDIILGNV
ncbi:MAG: hypothetical protein K2N63_11960 [Lachnospiraceae bacterium]|nr:hypothetical protein [Lachnospiraceae bacterium]